MLIDHIFCFIAEAYAPCLMVLENIHSLGMDRDGVSEGKVSLCRA